MRLEKGGIEGDKWSEGEQGSQSASGWVRGERQQANVQGVHHSLLVMWDTFSSFFRTASTREDVCSISSPKSPNMLKDTHTASLSH